MTIKKAGQNAKKSNEGMSKKAFGIFTNAPMRNHTQTDV